MMTRVFLSLVLLFTATDAWAQRDSAAAAATQPVAAAETTAAVLARGIAQLDSGEYRNAKATANQIIENDPANARAYVLRGRAETQLEDASAALKSLRKAQDLGEKVDAELGAVYVQTEEWPKAVEALAKGVEQRPEDGDAQYLYGIALYKTGKNAEARAALAKAAELDPEIEPEALVFSAAAALKAGDKPTAETELARAAELAEPGSDAAKAAKNALETLKGGGKAFSFGFGLANQYDTNVLLVPEADALFSPGEISNKDGNRVVVTLNGAWEPRFGESWRGLLGYGLYQSAHWTHRDTLKTFDVTNHALTLGATQRQERSTLALPYSFSAAYLNTFDANERYSFTHTLAPSYARKYGNHVFVLSDALGYEDYSVDMPAVLTDKGEEVEQSRDNVFNTLSLGYQLLFAGGRGMVSPAFSILYANAKGDNSWDNAGARLGLQSTVPLGKKWAIDAGLGFTSRSYANPFVIENAAGTPETGDRGDSEFGANAGVRYGSGPFNLGLSWNYTNNDSTVDAFTYQRIIYTLGFGLQY